MDLKPVNCLDFYWWHFPVAYGQKLKGEHSFEHLEYEGPKDSEDHMTPTVFALWNDNVASLRSRASGLQILVARDNRFWKNIPQKISSHKKQKKNLVFASNICPLTSQLHHLHCSLSINKFKLKWLKPEINYPSKGNVLENTIYGTITRLVRLSENSPVIKLIFYSITLLIFIFGECDRLYRAVKAVFTLR